MTYCFVEGRVDSRQPVQRALRVPRRNQAGNPGPENPHTYGILVDLLEQLDALTAMHLNRLARERRGQEARGRELVLGVVDPRLRILGSSAPCQRRRDVLRLRRRDRRRCARRGRGGCDCESGGGDRCRRRCVRGRLCGGHTRADGRQRAAARLLDFEPGCGGSALEILRRDLAERLALRRARAAGRNLGRDRHAGYLDVGSWYRRDDGSGKSGTEMRGRAVIASTVRRGGRCTRVLGSVAL